MRNKLVWPSSKIKHNRELGWRQYTFAANVLSGLFEKFKALLKSINPELHANLLEKYHDVQTSKVYIIENGFRHTLNIQCITPEIWIGVSFWKKLCRFEKKCWFDECKNTRMGKVFLDGDWQNKTEEIPPYKLAV